MTLAVLGDVARCACGAPFLLGGSWPSCEVVGADWHVLSHVELGLCGGRAGVSRCSRAAGRSRRQGPEDWRVKEGHGQVCAWGTAVCLI